MENGNEMIRKSFLWMFFGLLLTSATSWYCYSTESMQSFLIESAYMLAIIQLVVVLVFSFCFRKLSANVVSILFFVYAFLTGISFSALFYIYELGSLALIFAGSALLFLCLSMVGFITKKDMTKFGPLFTVGLIVGLILSIFNIFYGSSMLDLVLTLSLLILFMGLVIYDINKMKNVAQQVEDDDKLHIYFAFELYLDFINIFIRLVSLFAKEK